MTGITVTQYVTTPAYAHDNSRRETYLTVLRRNAVHVVAGKIDDARHSALLEVLLKRRRRRRDACGLRDICERGRSYFMSVCLFLSLVAEGEPSRTKYA